MRLWKLQRHFHEAAATVSSHSHSCSSMGLRLVYCPAPRLLKRNGPLITFTRLEKWDDSHFKFNIILMRFHFPKIIHRTCTATFLTAPLRFPPWFLMHCSGNQKRPGVHSFFKACFDLCRSHKKKSETPKKCVNAARTSASSFFFILAAAWQSVGSVHVTFTHFNRFFFYILTLLHVIYFKPDLIAGWDVTLLQSSGSKTKNNPQS